MSEPSKKVVSEPDKPQGYAEKPVETGYYEPRQDQKSYYEQPKSTGYYEPHQDQKQYYEQPQSTGYYESAPKKRSDKKK